MLKSGERTTGASKSGSFGVPFRIVLTILLVLAFIHSIDVFVLLDTFDVKHLHAFAASQVFQLPALLLVALRFGMLCGARRSADGAVLRGYGLALGLNSFVPGRMSELLKISFINRYSDIDAPTITAAVFSEKVVDLVILSALLLIGFGLIPVSSEYKYGFLMISALAVVLVAALVWSGAKIGSSGAEAGANAVIGFIRDVLVRLPKMFDTLTLLWVVIVSLVAWALSILVIYTILTLVLPAAVTFQQAFVVFSAMAIGRAIPGLPGSLGTYEAAIVLAMTTLGYNAEEALAAALTMRASQVVVVTIAGLLILCRDGTGLARLFQRNS